MVAKDWDFDYTVKDSYKSENLANTIYPVVDNASWTGDWWYDRYTVPNTSTISWTYTNTVYMYQIFCPKPRCKGVFWGQIDSVVECPKCKSRVKITNSPPPDYEVEITK